MLKKTLYPVLAVAGLGVLFSFNGCSCSAEVGTPPKTAEAPPPAAVPPPAPEPPPPAPAPAPTPAPEPKKEIKFKSIGKAKLEDGQIKIPGKIEFDVDKATIRNDPGSSEILTTLTDVLKANPNVSKIRIEGHTDNSGNAEHNKTLSKERADAVAKYLADHGVDKARLEAVGHGAEKPMVPNDSAANKQVNRRTEFHIVEMDGKTVDPSKFATPMATPPAVTPVATPAASAAPKPGETVVKPAAATGAKGGK